MAIPKSTFNTAMPYGIATLAIGVLGGSLAVMATATMIKVIGICAAIIGAYGFFAIVICGFVNSDNPQKFKEELPKYATTMIGSAIADIISKIATETIAQLIFGRENTIRIGAI